MCPRVAFIVSITTPTVLCIKPLSKPGNPSPAASNVEARFALSWFTNCATRKCCRSAKARFSGNVQIWQKASQLKDQPAIGSPAASSSTGNSTDECGQRIRSCAPATRRRGPAEISLGPGSALQVAEKVSLGETSVSPNHP